MNYDFTDAHYYLRLMNGLTGDRALIALNDVVLNDDRFLQAPGGVTKHHSYRHGLIIHTAEVMYNVVSMYVSRPPKELVTAVIWHDYMKCRDYALEWDQDCTKEVVRKTTYGNRIRHLAGSAMEFHREAHKRNIPQEQIETVEHLLLSHHGRREWGSPIEPATAEAFILHAADQMSAHGVNLQ